MTGLELEAVSADLTTFVPGRRLDDNAHVLMRFAGGARGVLAASQVAVGNLNNLSLKVYGSRAGLEWAGETPEFLRFTPYGEPSRMLQRGGPGNTSLAVEGSRMPGGHPEGYVEGFANLYRGAAELISARRSGRSPRRVGVADSERAGRGEGGSVYRGGGEVQPHERRLDFDPHRLTT